MADYESPDFGGSADLPTVAPNALQPYSPLNLPTAGPMPALPALPRADVASSPMMDIGRMLMGFAAGTQGRMNPIMQYEEQQRQRQLNQQLALAQLAMTDRARVVQERNLDRQLEHDKNTLEHQKTQDVIANKRLQADWAKTTLEYGTASGNTDAVYSGLLSMRDLGMPLPQDNTELRRIANDRVETEVLLKKGERLAASAIMGIKAPGMPEDMWQQAQTSEGRALLMATYKITDPKKVLTEQKTAEETLRQKTFENDMKGRLRVLETKGGALTAEEQLERDGIQRVLHGPTKDNNEMALAQQYVAKGMPLSLALPKAARELAQAKHIEPADKKDSNFDALVNEALRQNPNLTRGQAVAQAFGVQNAARKGTEDLEMRVEGMKQTVRQVKEYATAVHLYESKIGQAYQAGKALASSAIGGEYARNVAGLQRQLGYLAGVMRELGEKGVISEGDARRGERLFNATVWTQASASRDAIRELEEVVARGEDNLRQRQKAATFGASEAPAPNDPLGVRPRRPQ